MNVSCLTVPCTRTLIRVSDGRIAITGIEVIEPALVGELTDDFSRNRPRIRRSLARKPECQ